jgi:hypothetical protein
MVIEFLGEKGARAQVYATLPRSCTADTHRSASVKERLKNLRLSA